MMLKILQVVHFGNCNVYKADNIQYYPIYMVDLLRYENNNEKLIYKIDL